MVDVILSDPVEDKSLVQAHIAEVPHACFSDSDLFIAMPNGFRRDDDPQRSDSELVEAVEVPELIQRVQSHQVQLLIICCWARTSAQILIKCGERYDVGDKQRSTTFEGLESTGAKVKKFTPNFLKHKWEKSAQDLG